MEKLNLTPEEILNKEFKPDFKGYSSEEVDAYLDLILDDYQKTEDNIQELLDLVASLKSEIKDLNSKIVALQGKQRAIDLSNTTSYSNVDILKRVSRLEEEIFNK